MFIFLSLLICLIVSNVSVSYTHLDVYKRQSPDRNGESSSKTIATNGLTNYCIFKAPKLYSSTAPTHTIDYGDSGFDVAWAVESGSALVKTEKQSNGSCKVTALTAARSGSATITLSLIHI